MENFDLKKFLVENKLTKNSKLIKEEVELDLEQSFAEAGIDWSKTVVVFYQSVSGIPEPEVYESRPDDLLAALEENIQEYGDAIVSRDSRGEELLGYNEPEAEGRTYKLEVIIQDDGLYEIWQDEDKHSTSKAHPDNFSNDISVNPSLNEKKVR